MEKDKVFNIEFSVRYQKEYCESRKFPLFAPENGVCWNCRKNIYEEIKGQYGFTGYDTERAMLSHITGCPHCHRSYCE